MHRWIVLIPAAVIGLGTVWAQDATETEAARTREQTAADTRSAEVRQRGEELRDRLRRAIRLPRTTEEAREEGASEEQVREVLRTGRERGVPAGDMQEILEAENEELRRGGGSDNFGAAVQEMKASGLRGRDLADAIHSEQVARGMKKPKGKDKGKGKGKSKSKKQGRGGIMTRSRFSPTAMILLLALAIGAAGCDGGPRQSAENPTEEAQSARPDVVKEAVAIAKEIEADPDAAEAVLERHGLDAEQFEQMIYEISGDPELSKAYNAAME